MLYYGDHIMCINEPLHPDFQKILRQFIKQYGQDKGTRFFWAWINKLGLNPDKPYEHAFEAFSWAKSHFQWVKDDKTAKWYKVEALFPVSSMNKNVYTRDEMRAAARTLIGAPVDLNHIVYDQTKDQMKGVSIEDADYEDDIVEVLLRVANSAAHIQRMIDDEEIIHVSIEADCKRGWAWREGDPEYDEGWVCQGLKFTGLALLTKDVLPGVPLTRILPVEKLLESFTVTKMQKEQEKIQEKRAITKELGEPLTSDRKPRLEQTVDGSHTPCSYTKRIAGLESEKSELARKRARLLNTEIYMDIEQVLFHREDCEFHVKVADNLKEACKLLEVGFEYVTDMNGQKIFRKRK